VRRSREPEGSGRETLRLRGCRRPGAAGSRRIRGEAPRNYNRGPLWEGRTRRSPQRRGTCGARGGEGRRDGGGQARVAAVCVQGHSLSRSRNANRRAVVAGATRRPCCGDDTGSSYCVRSDGAFQIRPPGLAQTAPGGRVQPGPGLIPSLRNPIRMIRRDRGDLLCERQSRTAGAIAPAPILPLEVAVPALSDCRRFHTLSEPELSFSSRNEATTACGLAACSKLLAILVPEARLLSMHRVNLGPRQASLSRGNRRSDWFRPDVRALRRRPQPEQRARPLPQPKPQRKSLSLVLQPRIKPQPTREHPQAAPGLRYRTSTSSMTSDGTH